MDIDIGEIVTELTVTDGRHALTPEEKRDIVQAVAECIRAEKERARQREKDTGLRDRAYQPEGSANEA
jgi:hypothetical protein